MKQLNFRLCPFLIMHKNKLEKSYLIATIAISGFLLLSVTAAGTQSSHQAFAQGGTSMTNNEQFNSAAGSNNSTISPSGSTSGSASNASTTASPSTAVTPNELPSSQGTSNGSAPSQTTTSTSSQNEPPLNKNVVWQGFISSALSKVPGQEKDHSAVILAPRNDQGVYSGILTYQASKPVKVVVWNVVNPDNKTAIPKEFGSQEDMIKMGKNTVSLTTLGSSGKSGSIPFTGNAIELVKTGGGKNSDFTATYSVNVVGSQGKMVNNLQSLAAAALAANATGSNSTGSG
jgi:hypothetical protein